MRFLKYFMGILLILIGVFFAGGWMIPEEWSVSRTIAIHASTDRIYPYLSQFKEWETWSPWNASKDATLKYTYEGPSEGLGARQRWTSQKMGTGWMKLTAANPKMGVGYDLFIDMNGVKSMLHGTIVFVSADEETTVIWTDRGHSGNSFMKRWMSLMVKPMLGKDIEHGLAGLKKIVEAN